MNTRFRFKLIALLIILSLAGLVTFQGYWLKGLYDSLYTQMENNIKDAMRMADYQELFIRIQQIKEKENTLGKPTRNVDLSLNHADSLIFGKKKAADFPASRKNASLDITVPYEDPDFSTVDSTLTQYLHIMTQLEGYVQRAIHSQIDDIEPIRYQVYHDRLQQELRKRGIDTPTELTVNHQEKGKANATMYLGKHPAHLQGSHSETALRREIDELIKRPLEPNYAFWKNAVYFDYPVHSESHQFFRLYLKSPAQVVLSQMQGILVSSICLLVLIILAFVYMFRTLLRQKTVEEVKTDFTNNMTHELKTPISVGYSAVDALLNFSESLTGKQRRYLLIVKEQLIHLTGLVEQILTLAVENRNTFRLHPEPIELAPLAVSLAQQYKLKTTREVEFTLRIAPGLTVTADRTHLYNMLSNLIENAIKYTEKTPCQIFLGAEIADGQACISVTDNGIGIEEVHRKHLFDKFFRVPRGNLHNVKGYGLGLYYVKDMMEKHRGTVRVESVPGKGSTFTLCFKI